MSRRVVVRLSGVDDDAERLELATARLRAQLLSLDAVDADAPPVRRPPPPGSKGVDLAEIGNLVILLAQVPDGWARPGRSTRPSWSSTAIGSR
jgi:hypothetical protein